MSVSAAVPMGVPRVSGGAPRPASWKIVCSCGAELWAEPHGLEGTDNARRYASEQWHVGDAARTGDVVLGKGDNATGAHEAAEIPQRGGRVGQVHQDQSANYRVDGFVQGDRVNG